MPVVDAALRPPTLDEVFLRLTGGAGATEAAGRTGRTVRPASRTTTEESAA